MTSIAPVLLEVEPGVVSYGHDLVLEVGGFSVFPGDAAIFSGVNGSGKSSLFRAIVGLYCDFTGEIYLNKKNLTQMPVHKRIAEGIRLVPQERHIFTRLSIEQYLHLSSRGLGIGMPSRRQNSRSIIEGSNGLQIIQGRMPSGMKGYELSGGEGKIMLLSAMLRGDFQLLLLDEIFAGLDLKAVDVITSFLNHCIKDGVACLLTDHTGVAETIWSGLRRFKLGKNKTGRVPFHLDEI